MLALLKSVYAGDLPLLCFINTFHFLSILMAPLPLHPYVLSHLSISVFICDTLLATVALGYLAMFYSHTVRIVWNKNPPKLFSDSFFIVFYNYFLLVRPVTILFRKLTAPYRVLPNVIVLGEVRCGTTTLSQHLSSLPGCHPPFCPWKHPELDNKETFYFAGHYSDTSPVNYAMCFPLKATKWFYTTILRRPFFTFDGCAQYLTSPTAPYLIAEAYAARSLPPPMLIACVRDPVSQAVSWWKYENSAMLWGESMGLTSNNVQLRTTEYWSTTISDALAFSNGPLTTAVYLSAEGTVKARDASGDLDKFELPPWSLTWPGGQLTGIGRSGKFSENILRYERVFTSKFVEMASSETLNRLRSAVMQEVVCGGESSAGAPKRRFVSIVNLEEMNDSGDLKALLKNVMRCVGTHYGVQSDIKVDMYVEWTLQGGRGGVVRNKGGGGGAFEVGVEETTKLKLFFLGERERVEKLARRPMRGWVY